MNQKIPNKLDIANIPTPLQEINFNGCKFFIKRDDFTGVELSGNKIRKLEFLLHYAKENNYTIIFTTGGEQSNHARATVISAAAQGFKTKIFLWGKDSKKADGNLFLDKLFGAEIQFLNKKEFMNSNSIMEKEKIEFENRGEKVFIIPEGGSSPLGIWGYINFIDELQNQIDLKNIKGILTAAGSGGTSAGLLIGAALKNLDLKIYAVNVLMPKDEIQKRILTVVQNCINQFNLDCNLNENNLEILDGFSEEGYKNISDEKIKVIKNFAKQTGIILDPAYTGKAFYAYQKLFLQNQKSSDVIFVHTGGIFGAFEKKEKYLSN